MPEAEWLSKEEKMKLTLALAVAVVLAFVLGAAGGYAARGLNTAAAQATACPAGQHAVVWYTARTWACEPSS
jgi:hypothetical protein